MEQKTKKIKIKTNFAGSGFEIDVPYHYSVKDVLYFLIAEFIKDSATITDFSEEWEILMNEKEIWFYPNKLETQIKEGDLLEVYLTPLGGG